MTHGDHFRFQEHEDALAIYLLHLNLVHLSQDPLRPRHAPAHLGRGRLEREMIEPQLPKIISYSSTGMSI